jgi:hypothetical protein
MEIDHKTSHRISSGIFFDSFCGISNGRDNFFSPFEIVIVITVEEQRSCFGSAAASSQLDRHHLSESQNMARESDWLCLYTYNVFDDELGVTRSSKSPFSTGRLTSFSIFFFFFYFLSIRPRPPLLLFGDALPRTSSVEEQQ